MVEPTTEEIVATPGVTAGFIELDSIEDTTALILNPLTVVAGCAELVADPVVGVVVT